MLLTTENCLLLLLLIPGMAAVGGCPTCAGVASEASLLRRAEVDRRNRTLFARQSHAIPMLAAIGGVEERAIAAARPDVVANGRHDAEVHRLGGHHSLPGAGADRVFHVAVPTDTPASFRGSRAAFHFKRGE